MSWAIGFDENWQRDIGYGVPAYCDFPKCSAEIDRGLSHVCCGAQPYGGERGCGLYFCPDHLRYMYDKCSGCANYRPPFTPKPDHPEWIKHKLTDESWAKWRGENPEWVAANARPTASNRSSG